MATLADLMTTEVLIVAPEDTIGEVAERLRRADVFGLERSLEDGHGWNVGPLPNDAARDSGRFPIHSEGYCRLRCAARRPNCAV